MFLERLNEVSARIEALQNESGRTSCERGNVLRINQRFVLTVLIHRGPLIGVPVAQQVRLREARTHHQTG